MNCEKLYNRKKDLNTLSFVTNSQIRNKLQKGNFKKNVVDKKSKTNISMMAKKVVFGEDSRKALVTGINSVADAVKITLGPKGKRCIRKIVRSSTSDK